MRQVGCARTVRRVDVVEHPTQARFGLQEVKWGIVPKAGSTVHLPRQIPYARAMEILLTGELIKAPEALAIGFVNRLVPRSEVMAGGMPILCPITTTEAPSKAARA